MKVSIDRFNQVVCNWHNGDHLQRLGQTLMNKLLPSVVIPSIFYEEDNNKAHNDFQKKYLTND